MVLVSAGTLRSLLATRERFVSVAGSNWYSRTIPSAVNISGTVPMPLDEGIVAEG